MKLSEYADREMMALDVANRLGSELRAALAQNDTVTFAVPGGSTPGPVFDALSAVHLDWERVEVILTDERWVPEANALSNAALVRRRLLTGPAAAARLRTYYSERQTIAEAARTHAEALRDLLPVDVMVLGMGADMHTASLFPGARGLEQALAHNAPACLPILIDGQEIQRFTLTAPVLRAAGEVHVLITGQDKRDALERAADMPDEDAPIRTVMDLATFHWSA
ncbi:6-phosphogluconolactonase [Sulfitobacter sp. HNIBRBA3233]|uniref:6-phosphogluconolactonase n=1 Tax=Sulfitobacter marinivivus TaxID=3158558 RepID=UPI0032DF676C